MRSCAIWFATVTLILCGLAFGTTRYAHVPQPTLLTGMEESPTMAPGVTPHHHLRTLDDFPAGTTWYDTQTNGTAGKAIAVDPDGWIQVVWTNAIDNASATRRVYYNAWDPGSQLFLTETGTQLDNQTRAGYATIGLNSDGLGFALFHQIIGPSTNPPHTAYGVDFDPHYGVFFADDVHPHFPGNLELIWPHGDVDVNGNVHMVSTDYNAPMLHYYTRGIPHFTQNHADSLAFPPVFSSRFR